MANNKDATERKTKTEELSPEGQKSGKDALSAEAANTIPADVRNTMAAENQRVKESSQGLPELTVSDAVSYVLHEQAVEAVANLVHQRNAAIAHRDGSHPLEVEKMSGNGLYVELNSAEFEQSYYEGMVTVRVSDDGKSEAGVIKIHPDWLEETPSGVRIKAKHQSEVLGQLNGAFYESVKAYNKDVEALRDSMEETDEDLRASRKYDRELREKGKLGPKDPRAVKPAEIRNTRPTEVKETLGKGAKGAGGILGAWMLINAAARYLMTPSEEL